MVLGRIQKTGLAVALVCGASFGFAYEKASIQVLVTVDWEGSDLKEANLAAMEAFRQDFPEVPIVQFLNAAYYTKPHADAQAVTQKIRRTLKEGDELGLHIHGWKTLFEKAHVTFKDSPTFWGGKAKFSSHDYGHDVTIAAYSESEMRKVAKCSLSILEQAGFGRATTFRSGGWMGAETVLAALAKEGMKVDHSAVTWTFIEDELKGKPLLKWVKELWPNTVCTSQPYRLGNLVEVPDNGALADYVTAEEMLTVFQNNVEASKKASGKPQVVSIGFHQETAAKFLPRVASAIKSIQEQAAKSGVEVSFVTGAALALP